MQRPEIRENYRNYTPPRWVRRSIDRLIGSLGPEHINGLQAIVLTSSDAVGKGRTGRVGGRKYKLRECRGFYHRGQRDQAPWIEIVVDTTIPPLPGWLLFFNFMRDSILANVLYHEVGHHLDHTVGSASRGGEAAADDWCKRLTRIHSRRRYWYLRPVFHALQAIGRLPAVAKVRAEAMREARRQKRKS